MSCLVAGKQILFTPRGLLLLQHLINPLNVIGIAASKLLALFRRAGVVHADGIPRAAVLAEQPVQNPRAGGDAGARVVQQVFTRDAQLLKPPKMHAVHLHHAHVFGVVRVGGVHRRKGKLRLFPGDGLQQGGGNPEGVPDAGKALGLRHGRKAKK